MPSRPPRYSVEGVLYSMRQAVERPPRDMTLHEWLDLLLVRLVGVLTAYHVTDEQETADALECLKVYERAVFGEQE